MIATGAAPIKPQILQFFRAALGASVFEVGNYDNRLLIIIITYK